MPVPIRFFFILGFWLFAMQTGVIAAPPVEGSPILHTDTPTLIHAAQLAGKIDADTATLYIAYALFSPDQLAAAYHGSLPWDGTLPLLHLQQAVTTMSIGATRTTIEHLLAQPKTHAPTATYTTPHFSINYTPGTIGGGLTIEDYANSLETAWEVEVAQFGWAAPPNTDRYPVQLLAISYYGYVSLTSFVGNNPNTPWNDHDAYASAMTLNQNYASKPGIPRLALDATVAHEFNHSIQFGYGALTGSHVPDDVLVEASATWMEDEVFNDSNDNYHYLWPIFSACMGEYTDYPYRYWITLRGLTERLGTGIPGGGEQIMQDFWELTSREEEGNLLALATAISNTGTSLADAYHAYAIAVKFNKPCTEGSIAYPYCFAEGSAYVEAAGVPAIHGAINQVGYSYAGSISDNYALNWIALPISTTSYTISLTNIYTGSSGQLKASAVCDTGNGLIIFPFSAIAGAGQTVRLVGLNSGNCKSVIAVITNQAQTAANPDSCSLCSYLLKTTKSLSQVNHRIYFPLINNGKS